MSGQVHPVDGEVEAIHSFPKPTMRWELFTNVVVDALSRALWGSVFLPSPLHPSIPGCIGDGMSVISGLFLFSVTPKAESLLRKAVLCPYAPPSAQWWPCCGWGGGSSVRPHYPLMPFTWWQVRLGITWTTTPPSRSPSLILMFFKHLTHLHTQHTYPLFPFWDIYNFPSNEFRVVFAPFLCCG